MHNIPFPEPWRRGNRRCGHRTRGTARTVDLAALIAERGADSR
jgi:hypothetical protein